MTYIFVGGRDYVGRPILSLTQPEQNGVEDLMELTDQELLDMFAYFTSVPRCSLIAINIVHVHSPNNTRKIMLCVEHVLFILAFDVSIHMVHGIVHVGCHACS